MITKKNTPAINKENKNNSNFLPPAQLKEVSEPHTHDTVRSEERNHHSDGDPHFVQRGTVSEARPACRDELQTRVHPVQCVVCVVAAELSA